MNTKDLIAIGLLALVAVVFLKKSGSAVSYPIGGSRPVATVPAPQPSMMPIPTTLDWPPSVE